MYLARSMLEDDHYIVNTRNAHIDTSAFERELFDRLSVLQDAAENEIYESVYEGVFSWTNVAPSEPDEDRLVCRYLTPAKFLRFLDSRLVNFPAATQFADRWECSIPKDYNNAILRVLNKMDRSAAGWTGYVRKKADWWNVSCWTQLADYFDDHLMWDSYADGPHGVGVTIRYGPLKAHLARAAKQLDADGHLQSGLVNYETLSILPFNKHYMFRNEKEVRFAFRGFQPGATSISIDEIFNLFGVRISPAATEDHHDMVRTLWLRYGGEDRIQWPR